jgi:hypothetical protein
MLTQLKDYLVSKGTARDKEIPYYCKWVADCYTACNAQNSTILSPQKKQFFLKQMAKDHEDWQVKPADAALRLYEYFLTSHEKKQSSVSASLPAEWERPVLQNLLPFTRFDTVLPRIFWKMDTTSEQYRSCWDMPISRQP